MLMLEVEFLTGVSVAASPQARTEAEWPPHPDRLFLALVAAWGRNAPPDEAERAALEWLERRDMSRLRIFAPEAYARDIATVFVPPNDAQTTGRLGQPIPKNLNAALRVVPEARKNRQPRAFPAVVVGETGGRAIVRYSWALEAAELEDWTRHKAALARITREVTYLGHSHSTVRVAVVDPAAIDPCSEWDEIPSTTVRVPYEGRLKEVCRHYDQSKNEGRLVRPKPSLVVRTYDPPSKPDPETVFDADNATILVDAGGFVPDLAAFPLVAKRLRDALLSCAPKGSPVPALLSGHDADSRPSDRPHIAIVPLADVGWAHSQGRLMGVAIVWPRDTDPNERTVAIKALHAFGRQEKSDAGLLHFGEHGSWSLALDPEPERASLRFQRYASRANRWGTVLPAALDRHPKDKPGETVADIVIRACTNLNLSPEAIHGIDIEIHKHPPVKGAPSVKDVIRAVAHDSPYRTKPFAHLVLSFPNPIRGPLILGAGRFRGLGLCLPL